MSVSGRIMRIRNYGGVKARPAARDWSGEMALLDTQCLDQGCAAD